MSAVPELLPSVGFASQLQSRFPECHPQAVRGPERFRGGCAFGAALRWRARQSLPQGHLTDACLSVAETGVNRPKVGKGYTTPKY